MSASDAVQRFLYYTRMLQTQGQWKGLDVWQMLAQIFSVATNTRRRWLQLMENISFLVFIAFQTAVQWREAHHFLNRPRFDTPTFTGVPYTMTWATTSTELTLRWVRQSNLLSRSLGASIFATFQKSRGSASQSGVQQKLGKISKLTHKERSRTLAFLSRVDQNVYD